MDVKKIVTLMQAAAGLNSTETAAKIGKRKQNYSALVSGKDIKLTTLLEIAAATGCKLTLTGPGINIDLAPDAPAPQEDN